MFPSDQNESFLKGKGLKYRLVLIEILVFLLPSLVVLYIYYTNDFTLKLSQILIVPFILLTILTGFLLMRKIFDMFSAVDSVIKKAGGVGEYFTDIKKDTSELHEVTDYFTSLMDRFESSTSELRRRVFELFSIKELTEFASKTLEMDVLLNILLEKAMAITESKNGTIYIYEPDEKVFRVVASRGPESSSKTGSFLDIDVTLKSNKVFDNIPIFIQEIDSDLVIAKPDEVKDQMPSTLTMQIFVRGNLLGRLTLSHGKSGKPFNANDKQIIYILISEIGFALENARLYKEVERHLNELQNHAIELSRTNNRLQSEIAERKRIEESLKETNEFLTNILDSSQAISIISTDLEKNITFWNKGAEMIFGYKAEEVVGRHKMDILYPDEETKKRADMMRSMILKKQHVINAEMKEINKRGDIIWLDLNLTPTLDEKGNVIGILGLGIDITKRKTLEQQLLQAQKMEAIGTLAGGIAHDFNNILTAIIGYTELANLRVHDKDNLKQYISEVLAASGRAKSLVEHILSFSRQTKFEQKLIQVQPIVKEALKLLRASLPSTIEIQENLALESGVIMADPTQIHQVLLNLCANAKHAMEKEGGTLTICLLQEEISEESIFIEQGIEPGPYLKLTISDTGCGIPPEIIKRVFEPYFTTKEHGEGTGLGLAVVHGIVKSHNGVITVESEIGRGTTFHIYLPLVENPEEYEDEAHVESISLGNERILFVDDERTLAELGKDMLEFLGYNVVAKTSSIEAFQLFKKEKENFHLVITDMTMPKMTGEMLAKEVLKIRPDIPIILCTGFSEKMTEKRAKEIGIKAFLMKPLVMRDLSNTIRSVLDGELN